MNLCMRRSIFFVILIAVLVPILGCPVEGGGDLTSRVQALEAALAITQADLLIAEAKLVHVSVEQGAINGLTGPHLIIEGCNLHVRSGSGDSRDSAGLTGLGNVIVGYNELPATEVYGRLGSHNLVVGMEHEYSNFGGFVAGRQNVVTGQESSVSGGMGNMAGGQGSSVSGGTSNLAGGLLSSVVGGSDNMASGEHSSVGGGTGNNASGNFSSVSAGAINTAEGRQSAVSGGLSNRAGGELSTVGGGQTNTAGGFVASVSGGADRTAPNTSNWAAGSLLESN